MNNTVSINRNTDFRRMYRRAVYKNGCLTVVYMSRNRLGVARLGITVSKKVGNAVKRNRVRRIISVAYRQLSYKYFFCGFDVVIVAKRSAVVANMNDILVDMERSILKLYNGAFKFKKCVRRYGF